MNQQELVAAQTATGAWGLAVPSSLLLYMLEFFKMKS